MNRLRSALLVGAFSLAAVLGTPAAVSADDFTCRGTIWARTLDNVKVPRGATCTLKGDVGPLGAALKDRPEGHSERCRWWLYSAPGDDTMLVEQWGSDYRVLRGKKVGDSTIELMPGS